MINKHDYEGKEARFQLSKIETYAKKLNDMIHDQDELETWVQNKLTLVAGYMADIKNYLDKELANAGQSLHRDDIDDLLTEEYEAYQDLKRNNSPENWERVERVHEKIKNYELEEESKSGLHDYTVETGTEFFHIKAHNLKEAKHKAQEMVAKDTIKNKVINVFKKGGITEETESTMWKVRPTTMAEDMLEARELIGNEKWKSLSRKEREDLTKYLKFKGDIGLPGQEEDIETISGLQYYAKGGNVRWIKDDEKHKHSWGRTSGSIGEFDIKDGGKWWYGTLYPIDDFDKDYWKGVKLKPEEKLFRYETYATKVGNMRPVVKINVERGIIYFLKDLYSDDDKNLQFETKGTKLKLLQLNEKIK